MSWLLIWSGVALGVLAGCSLDGGDDGYPSTYYCEDFDPIAGGGASGPEDGAGPTLRVCVLEPNDIRSGVPNAFVKLDTGEEGFTDNTGVIEFFGVASPASITVADPRYVMTTWQGITGDAVTIIVEPNPPSITYASGTIDGWDALPAPAPGHYLVAEVQFTRSPDPLVATDALLEGQTANRCYRWTEVAAPCNWMLVTRSGFQRWIATVVDADTNGTPEDLGDDHFTVIGYAAGDTVYLDSSAPLDDVVLMMLPPAELMPITVEFEEPQLGLGQRVAIPTLEQYDGQRIVFSFPPITPDSPSSTVIRNRDNSFTGPYHIEERASAPGTTTPYTARGACDVDPASVGHLGSWGNPLRLGRTGPRRWSASRSGSLQVARFSRDGTPLWNLVQVGIGAGIEPPPWLPLGTGPLQIEATVLDPSTGWSTSNFEYRDLARGPRSSAGAITTFEDP